MSDLREREFGGQKGFEPSCHAFGDVGAGVAGRDLLTHRMTADRTTISPGFNNDHTSLPWIRRHIFQSPCIVAMAIHLSVTMGASGWSIRFFHLYCYVKIIFKFVGLSNICYTLCRKLFRVSLGDFQPSGLIGKLLYFLL